MAKDGTNRGGRRVRAGAKPDPLNEKLAAGEPILLETGLGGDLVKRYEDLVDRMIAELTVVSFGSSGDVGEESWAVENSVVP